MTIAPSEALEAGTASVDLTPPMGQPMCGYPDSGPAEDVLDPHLARVLVLKSADVCVALVSLDLGVYPSRRVVEEARARWQVDHVILSCTHTHSGAMPQSGFFGWDLNRGPDEHHDFDSTCHDPWYVGTQEKIIAAIGQAMANRFPARLGVGGGSLREYLAHNRRYVQPDGRVTMMWANPQRIPTGPLDPSVRVLRVEDHAGRTRAVAVHYACHAVTLGGKNRSISADFPGAMVRQVEAHYGPDCMAMFLQGASGDIDPCDMGLDGEAGRRAVQANGATLAREALAVAGAIVMQPPSRAPIRVKTSLLTFQRRLDPARTATLAVTTLVLQNVVALVAIPGEVFVQHQLNLSAAAPLPHALVLGLAYSGQGLPIVVYLPTEQAAREGGYGADSVTFLEPTAGRRLMQESLRDMRELMNGVTANLQ